MDDRDGPSPDELRHEIERLRAENRRLQSLLGERPRTGDRPTAAADDCLGAHPLPRTVGER